MVNWQRRVGILFGIICLLAWTMNFVNSIFFKRYPGLSAMINPVQLSLLAFGIGFFLSARFPRFGWFQPAVMVIVTALPFMDSEQGSSTMYGLGFFVITIFLLNKSGFYDKRRVLKFFLSLVYLYGLEIFAAFRNARNPLKAFMPVFFITIFLVFLYVMFNERVTVYLKEPKPIISLGEKGLSPAERTYVRALTHGQNPKEIAAVWSVSESTVRNTLSRAYKKLGIDDRNSLTKMSERYELVD